MGGLAGWPWVGSDREGLVAWVGEGQVRAIPDMAGLLLTSSTIPDRWTPWVFIDPLSV